MMSTGRSDRDQPPRWRVIAAFLIAPLVSAFALACYLPAYDGLPHTSDRIIRSTALYCFFGGYPSALVVGVPAYLLLRRRLKPTWLNCTIAGAVVAAAPSLLLMIVPTPGAFEQTGEHITVLNGVRTAWGWMEGLQGVAGIGAVGLIGGLAFWLIAVAGWRRTASA
jgi:hypothetical protein